MNTPTNTAVSPLSITDVIRLRNYRLLWLSQVASNTGDALTSLALVLLVNRISGGSASAIAGILIAYTFPSVAFGLIAGAIVDRLPRKRVMIMAELTQMVFAFGFVLLLLLPQTPLWSVYVLAFLSATAGAFFTPARMALLPAVVPPHGLMAANSLGQMTRVLFTVVGTSLAGFLVGTLDQYALVFALDAVTFIISPLLIWRIAVDEESGEQPAATLPTLLQVMGAGVSLIARNRVLSGALMGLSITMLGIGAINVLLPPLLVNQMQVSETWFGAINFAQSAAMILGGTFVAALSARFKETRIVSMSLLGLGFVGMSFALVGNIWHLFPILFAAGLMITPLQAATATIMQTRVASATLGRVGAAMNTLIGFASLVSMLFAGVLADLLGIRLVFVIGGVITLSAALVAAAFFRGTEQTAPPREEEPASAAATA